MTDGLSPPPLFIADAPGLDFLNSIGSPADMKVEWLGSGADLLAWLAEAKIVPDAVLAALEKTAIPGELDGVAAQARALREWFRGFVAAHKGRPLKPKVLDELGPLNRVLARDEEFGQIVAREKGRKAQALWARAAKEETLLEFEWSLERRWRSPESLLLPIAKAMADLVCDEDFSRVKACEGHSCTLLFVDRTRGHVRRWCSMAICGNRAKQAAHRDRRSRRR
jgi:CGNR zinc finger/Putative stress-induced transcription regulator